MLAVLQFCSLLKIRRRRRRRRIGRLWHVKWLFPSDEFWWRPLRLFVVSAAAVTWFPLSGSVKVNGLQGNRKWYIYIYMLVLNERLVSERWVCFLAAETFSLRYMLRLLLGNFRALGMLPWWYYREQHYLPSPRHRAAFTCGWLIPDIQTGCFYRVLRWLPKTSFTRSD